MSKKIFKSIWAVLAGFLVIAILSAIVDTILENTGVLPKDTLPLQGDELLVLGVLGYRAVFSVLGCYLAARLAPSNPMKHALALGIFGAVFSALGSIAMSDLQPFWYGVVLVLMSIPLAWLGGKIYELTSK